ncbi:hypothetical protein BGZ72_003987 [Mortierella alpina]|nr:hypothetical protein BGZ72_003987 [Mortierella alpina]
MSNPSFLSSISETARAFFGRFSSSLRARPSNALLHSSTSSLPLTPPAPSVLSRFALSSVSLSTDYEASSTADISQQSVRTQSSLADDDVEKILGAPSKKRFEGSGFSFHFKNRNSSTSSLLNSAGEGLKTSLYKQPQHHQPSHQHPQYLEQQQLSQAKQQRRYLQHLSKPSADRAIRKGVRHSSILSAGVVHVSSSDKMPTKQRPVFKRHHTDTPCSSTKEDPPALKLMSDVNANGNTSRATFPKSVAIRNLPEYIPDAGFGHNAKRNEKYARIRLAALREHQQALVSLLSNLLETENRYREQHQHLQQAVASGHSGDRPNLDAQNIHIEAHQTSRQHQREAAAQEYQKALLDLWQADNSLCHWLIRYIRTARRVSRNLDLMLLDSSTASASGSPVSLKDNASTTNVLRPSGILAENAHSSTFDLVSATLPHVDEVSRWKGQSAALKTPDPVMAGASNPRVSQRSAPSSHSLLRIPFQAPTSPPPPVPAPQPPRDFMNSAPGGRCASQSVVQVHIPSHHRAQLQDSLSLQPRKTSVAVGDFAEEKRFDELDALVFVGRHMQCLQKANEFLHRFDREACQSKIMLERFEKAREVYRRRVNRG